MSAETAAAPALPLQVLLPRLAECFLPKPVCKSLQKDAIFQQIQFRCQQISYVHDIAESQHGISISTNALAKAFDCPRSRVKSALAHGLEPPGHRGKHNALDPDREQQILDWIKQNAETNTPVTKKEIKDYCVSKFQIPITRGWVNSFVLRNSDDIIATKSVPQEERRLHVPRVFLDRTV
jgi:hypothetical protein